MREIKARIRLLRNSEIKKGSRNSLPGSHNFSVLLLKGSLQEHFQECHLCNVFAAVCKEGTIRKYDIADYIFVLVVLITYSPF